MTTRQPLVPVGNLQNTIHANVQGTKTAPAAAKKAVVVVEVNPAVAETETVEAAPASPTPSDNVEEIHSANSAVRYSNPPQAPRATFMSPTDTMFSPCTQV